MTISIGKNANYLQEVSARFQDCPAILELIQRIEQNSTERISISGLTGSSPAFLVNSLNQETKRPV